MRQRAFSVKLLGRHGRREDELDAPVVQHVHQPGEAARLAGQAHRHVRHVGQQHGMELAGDLQVVVLRARAAAQGTEVEPHHAAGTAPRGDLARLDVQHRVVVARVGGQASEGVVHGGIGLGAERAVVELHLLQRAAAVVGAMVDVDDLHARVQQLDGGQDAVAVQAAGVEVVRLEVAGGDEAHAVVEQRQQQPVQDHGVGDVGDVELVEADQLELARHALAQLVQRVDGALQGGQLAVHLAHELVKVQPRLAADRHGVVEAVHQKALAAADAAVHVDALGNGRVADELLDRVGAPLLVARPLLGAALQRLDRAQLRRVTLVAACGQFRLVSVANTGHALKSCRRWP